MFSLQYLLKNGMQMASNVIKIDNLKIIYNNIKLKII